MTGICSRTTHLRRYSMNSASLDIRPGHVARLNFLNIRTSGRARLNILHIRLGNDVRLNFLNIRLDIGACSR